jgi:hypothetical protein
MEKSGVPMLLIDNTEDAARHALLNGFISPSSMPDIARQLEEDHNYTIADSFNPDKDPVSS